MGEHTTTTWDCHRCKVEVVTVGREQPEGWSSMYRVHPPRGSFELGIFLGHLCPLCNDEVVPFMCGSEIPLPKTVG